MRHRSLFAIAFALAVAAALAAPSPGYADPAQELVEQLPAEVLGLSRIPGPEGETTSFVVLREAERDRLFIQTKGAGTTAIEVDDLGASLPGRVSDLRSERDSLGIAVFVDLILPGGDLTTYELFWDGEDASSYIFRPASN